MLETTSGGVNLDFSQAEVPHREVTVEVTTRSGTVVLVVPRAWHVRIESASANSGSVTNKATEPPRSGAPTLRVHGSVRSGCVKVRYPYRDKNR